MIKYSACCNVPVIGNYCPICNDFCITYISINYFKTTIMEINEIRITKYNALQKTALYVEADHETAKEIFEFILELRKKENG